MYSDLEEIIHQLKSCTSLLDNIPNKLFKSVSRCFTDDIINSSLQTEVFPVSLRCAVITLLLNKNNLESLVMNNYRGISNFSFLKIFEKCLQTTG